MGLAFALLAVILIRDRFSRPPSLGPSKVLAELRVPAVTAIQVRYKDQLEVIRAERTNSVWQLTKPVDYRAQTSSIERLLDTLDRLAPAVYLSDHERRSRPQAEEEEGLAQPQAAVFLQQGERTFQIDIGAPTPPGDQLYLQVAGNTGVYIVDAELLKILPKTKDDWRDRTLMDLKGLAYDRVTVTNGPRVLEFQRGPTLGQWQIVNPPIQARADAERLDGMLLQLGGLRVAQFISDNPKADLESFGLQPPALAIGLAQGTNLAVQLQFGRSPTNDPAQVHARRAGQNTIVTVPTNGLSRWLDSVSAFRDPHLIRLPVAPVAITVRADEIFSVQLQGTNGWRILTNDLAVDPTAVQDLLAVLTESPIVEFHDVVTPLDLPKYGLSHPSRQYILKAADASPSATNYILVELDFGFTNDNKVFVSRPDETSVYAISLAEFQRLPGASFQLRPRRLWQFAPDDVQRVVIHQTGKERQILHSGEGPPAWSLAQGSQGVIEPLSVNETTKAFGQLEVTNWVARGEASRARYGLTPPPRQLTFQLKNGEKPTVEIGAPSPGNSLYGAVKQGGEFWIFEFPAWLARELNQFLSIPP